ncbi:hypothetical protein [Moraxella lacunata]|uniref:hypothetical protein n=1 Tax=Moraxella lacunata TaxID=477 RepID=UPI003EE356F9
MQIFETWFLTFCLVMIELNTITCIHSKLLIGQCSSFYPILAHDNNHMLGLK